MSTMADKDTGRARPRASQKQIAELAGVAQSTVSVVLAGRAAAGGISAETATQILRIAAEVGYRPNIAAQRMRGVNSRILGVHTYGDALPISHHNLNHAYLLGIQLATEAHGYDLLLFTSTMQGDGRPSAFVDEANRLAAADGAIIIGYRADHEELARLASDGYPFVRIGRREMDDAVVSWIDVDHRRAAAEMVESLDRAGFAPQVHLVDLVADERAEDLRAGTRDGATARGLSHREHVLHRNDITSDFIEGLLAYGPVTVVAETHALASRTLQAANEIGLRAGRQLQVAVMDSPFSDLAESVYCAYVVEPRTEIGRLAGEYLVQMVAHGAEPLALRVPGSVAIARPPIRADRS